MIKLTTEEKDILRAFTKSDAFRILKKVEDDAMKELSGTLMIGDLSDPEVLEIIKKNQIYMNARRDFFSNTEKHVSDIVMPQQKGID